MQNLNSEQQKAASYQGKHLLVLAGAGTGKTKTIVARSQYLIDNGVDPKKIQILTFTKKASAEIVSRISTKKSNGSVGGSTFHSWCNHLLLRFPSIFKVSNFTVIDEDDQVAMMKLVCGNKSVVYQGLKIKPEQLVDLYSFFRNSKINLTTAIRNKFFNRHETTEINEQIEGIKPKVTEILQQYQQKKQANRYVDYDDILIIVAKGLATSDEARKQVSSHYEHILVDEMQDTNPLQWDLLKNFVEYSHLFCVGDDAQSIYGFRGADFKNIHQFTQNVPDAEVLKLEENYRSTQEILDVSNWVLENSPLNYDKKLVAYRGLGNKPEVINVQNEWDEANFVADKIEQNFEEGKMFSDHLVLSRSQYATKEIQAVFIQRKIPFVVFGGRKFMESAHIKDMFSALRVVNNHQDEIAWTRFLTLWNGIGEAKASRYIAEILKLENINEAISIFKNSKGESEQKIFKILNDIQANLKDLSKVIGETYLNMRDMFVEKYPDWDEKRKPDFPVLETLSGNYFTLNELISELQLDTSLNNQPTLHKVLLNESEEKDCVIISTIHSAKGLEADTAFVIRASPGNYPSTRSLLNQDDMEEERRVLYVALTRAKNHLYIIRNTNAVQGDLMKDKSSRSGYFFNSLPDDLVVQNINFQKNNSIKESDGGFDVDISSDLDWN